MRLASDESLTSVVARRIVAHPRNITNVSLSIDQASSTTRGVSDISLSSVSASRIVPIVRSSHVISLSADATQRFISRAAQDISLSIDSPSRPIATWSLDSSNTRIIGLLGSRLAGLGQISIGYSRSDYISVTWYAMQNSKDKTQKLLLTNEGDGTATVLKRNISSTITIKQAKQAIVDGALLATPTPNRLL